MLNPTMINYIKAYYLPPNAQVNEASGYNYIENRAHIDKSDRYQVRLDFHGNNNNFGFARVRTPLLRADRGCLTALSSQRAGVAHSLLDSNFEIGVFSSALT